MCYQIRLAITTRENFDYFTVLDFIICLCVVELKYSSRKDVSCHLTNFYTPRRSTEWSTSKLKLKKKLKQNKSTTMFEGLPKIKHCCGMDLKIICIILGVLELGFLALRLGNNFCLFHCNDRQTFVVIEFYIQLCIHIARVVLTICLMYGLVTRKVHCLHIYIMPMIFCCIYYFLMSNVMLFTNFDVAIEYFIQFFLDSITWLFVHSLHEIWRKQEYEKANPEP
uniref:CSON006054 protein n=1 Tax=Culicoides sonorensis TaxID=179676 RepID=A0A336MWR2_CULSO